jgi:PAS domain S-box-containing protein
MQETNSLIAYRLRTVRIGVQATFLVLVPLVGFLFIPSSIPMNEPVYISVIGAAAVGAVVIATLPWRRLFEKGRGLPTMYVWSVLDILLITAILQSAGENGAPFFVLYALTTAFAAASYRPRAIAAVVAFTFVAYAGMILIFEDKLIVAATLVRFSALVGVAFITGFLSGELMAQNRRLEEEVAERQAAESRLKKSQAQLAEAQHLAQLGSWEWDVKANELTWSGELLRIFGVDRDEFGADYDSYIARIHPEDRAWVNERIQMAYDNLEPFTFEHRIIRADGTERVLLARGVVEADDKGGATSMVGTAIDMTDRIEAERSQRELAELEARHQQAMEINDNVVQGLTVAAYSLEIHEEQRAGKAIRATLGAARKIVEKLLSGRYGEMQPGDFVRSEPAMVKLDEETADK